MSKEGGTRRILIRSKEERSYVTEYPFSNAPVENEFPVIKSDLAVASRGGGRIAGVHPDAAAFAWDVATAKELSRFGKDVSYVAISPLGTYAVTWCRYSLAPSENLCVWNAKTGERLAKFSQKDYSKSKWPSIQWTDDESEACRAVTNEVHFFDGNNLGGSIKYKVRAPKVEYFALSRGRSPYRLATFSAGTKSDPAKVILWKLPEGEVISTKSIFLADESKFIWSSSGSAVLALVSSARDPDNKSYYGKTNLYFLDALGERDQRVELPKEGPIHDSKWAPSGTPQFIVIYGAQPARATLFNSKCEPVFDFGSGSWNSLYFSPHGRFVAICGFRSISTGEVVVWDRVAEKKIGVAKMVDTISFSWSPCSRYIMSATTVEGLRVDNGYRIFEYNGSLVEKKEFKGHVLQAEFLPAPAGAFPDRPASPRSLEIAEEAANKLAASAGGKTKLADLANASGVYRPPAARGGSETTFNFRDPSEKVEAGKVSAANWRAKASTTANSVPGAEPDETQGLTSSQKKNRKKKVKKQEQKQQSEEAAKPSGENEEPEEPEAIQKKIRNLKKKLRRATDKKKAAAEKELEENEKTLVDSIPAMEKEISVLEKKLEKL